MFRLRRYRVFLVFTVVVVGALYYLAATGELENAGASVEGLRKFGHKESPQKLKTQQPPELPTIDNHFHGDSKPGLASSPTSPGITPSPAYPEEQSSPTTRTLAVEQENTQKPLEADEDLSIFKPDKLAELDGITGEFLEDVKSEKPLAPTISPDLDRVRGNISKNLKAGNPGAATTSSGFDRVNSDSLKNAKSKPAPTISSPTPEEIKVGTWKDVNTDISATGTAIPALDGKPVPHGVGRLDGVSDVQKPTIHWKRLPEHFPIPSQSIIPLPSGRPKAIPKIQHVFSDESASEKIDRLQKLNAIKDAFLISWNGYKEKAWMQDELSPLSGLFRNPFCGWAATLVDSLDTLWIMGLKEEFEEATNAIKKIDFTTSNRQELPLFEVVIRYLGGLIAAYDLSSGTYRVLLDKAVELAEVLIGAFDTPNRMPLTFYPWKPYVRLSAFEMRHSHSSRAFASQPHRAHPKVVLAELGSLSVEFTRLAQLTRESKYYDAIARITNEFEAWQNNTKLPGLWPTKVDASGCKKHVMSSAAQKNHSLLNGPANEIVKIPHDLASSRKSTADYSTIHRQSSEEDGQNRKTSPKDQPLSKSEKVMPDRLDIYGQSSEEDGQDNRRTDPKELPSNKNKSGKDKTDHSVIYDQFSEDDEQETRKTSPKALSSSQIGKAAADHSATYGQSWEEEGPKSRKSYDGRSSGLKGSSFSDTDADFDAWSEPKVGRIKRQLSENAVETSTPIAKALQDEAETSTPTANALGDMPDCEPQGLASPPGSDDEEFTLGGQADSVYEYLPKQYMLLGGLEDKYRSMYEKAIEVSKKYLLFRPMLPDNRDILLSGSVKAKGGLDKPKTFLLQPEGSHLTCFVGGMFAIGAKIFDRENDLELAKKLTDGCVWAYEATTTGIMPEHYLAVPCTSRVSCSWNKTKYEELIDPQWKRRAEEQGQLRSERQQHAKNDEGLQAQIGSKREKLLSEDQENPPTHHDARRAQHAEAPEIWPTGHEEFLKASASKNGPLARRQLRETESELPLKPAAKITKTSATEDLPDSDAVFEKDRTEKENAQVADERTKAESELPLNSSARMLETSTKKSPESQVIYVDYPTEKETGRRNRESRVEADDLARSEREVPLEPAAKTVQAPTREDRSDLETVYVKHHAEKEKEMEKTEEVNAEAVAIDTENAKAKVTPAKPPTTAAEDRSDKLHPEKLPPGMTTVSGTNYILRYVTFNPSNHA